MTKIKNFRISCRPRDMARWLKKERALETTPDLELSIEQVLKEGKSWIAPAAVYTTLTKPVAEKTTALGFPDKAIAASIVAVSIGPALEKERAATQDGAREALLTALQQEALSQALQFVVRLISEQAKEEDCEMSPLVFSEDPSFVSALSALVGVQRIGIPLESPTDLVPPHARVAWLFWTPVGKGKGQTPAGRQAGAEKVAA